MEQTSYFKEIKEILYNQDKYRNLKRSVMFIVGFFVFSIIPDLVFENDRAFSYQLWGLIIIGWVVFKCIAAYEYRKPLSDGIMAVVGIVCVIIGNYYEQSMEMLSIFFPFYQVPFLLYLAIFIWKRKIWEKEGKLYHHMKGLFGLGFVTCIIWLFQYGQ